MSDRAPEHPGTPYFESVAETLGAAYDRYSFTRGTGREVRFLLDLLRLPAGARLLDVGCGTGRHAVGLAEAGLAVTGVDVSRRFLDVAAERAGQAGVKAAFFQVDARRMPFDDEFDAVISICQGAFGLMGEDDSLVLRRMMEAARPGAPVIVTACSALFAALHPPERSSYDVGRGVVHETTIIRDEKGKEHEAELWTSVYTPRELRLLAIGVGLVPEAVWSVEPGDFAARPPDAEHAEFMLLARRP